MNLKDDLEQCLKEWFSKLSVIVTPNLNAHGLLERFINTQAKLIKAKPRQVLESDVIGARRLDDGQTHALNELRRKLQRGENVCPHLNKGSMRIDFNDDLLNDWGIHHFHLSITKSDPSQFFFDRSGPVLFARIESNKVFFIDIREHGSSGEPDVFAKQELLDIMDRNWPDIAKPYILKGFGLPNALSDNQIKKMRSSGINVIVAINGKPLASMGGGITTAGTNIMHTMKADRMLHELLGCEEELKRLKTTLASSYYPPQNFDFKLEMQNGEFIVKQFPEGKVVNKFSI